MSLKPYFARNIVKQISTRKSGSYSDKARKDKESERARFEHSLKKRGKRTTSYVPTEGAKLIEDPSESYQIYI